MARWTCAGVGVVCFVAIAVAGGGAPRGPMRAAPRVAARVATRTTYTTHAELRERSQKPAVNPTAAAVAAFDARLKAYIALRQKAAAPLPPLKGTRDAGKILEHERLLAAAIRAARPGAKAGDLFDRDVGLLLVQTIRRDWKARLPRDRAALLAEMPRPFVPRVHMEYPPSQPYVTFPAKLLGQLHRLPDDLEYRFVGRHLILRDAQANLILDVIRDVLQG